MTNYKHWNVNTDEKNIIWLGLDRQDAPLNTINSEVLDELNSLIISIEKQPEIKGLVIYSLKNKGFIAGADIRSFSNLSDQTLIAEFLKKGQSVFSRLESLTIPTVAMIDGFCLGGGLELVLACNYRIASDNPDTKLGLPEILLGIHPGWGGTVRLSKLIGGYDALTQVMLTGRALSANTALRLGIVDEVVPVRQLQRTVQYYLANKPARHAPRFLQSLSNIGFVRPLIGSMIRKQMSKKVRQEHYPAPFALVDLWEKESGFGARAYLKEIESIENIVTQNETASNLIRAFFLKERLKAFAKNSDFKAQHVHVIGAGVMGGDIAAWCALKGIHVTLQDRSYEQIAPAIQRAQGLFKKKLRASRLVQAAMDRLLPDPDGFGIRKADVIIEAVFENLEVKQAVAKDIEAKAKPTAIIATNTSSIPLDEISVVMKNPSRLVGIHYFNPVAKMELVEVVSSEITEPTVIEDACAFVGQISRLPLPVKSSPGFLVNRVLMPYLMESVQLLEEGFQPEAIDEAACSFGMMMGPVELADTVGIDVCLAVAKNLTSYYGGSVPKKLVEFVATGKLGKKSGEGFYRYDKKGKVIKAPVEKTGLFADIQNRLILRMVNEAAACLREKVVADADLLDAGMIFGTGFAPFRGGPMHYAKQFGRDQLNQLFEQLSSIHGDRFKADAGL